MSHQSLAAIWIQLEARTDIDNILRDLIGQNSLESSVLDVNSDKLLNSSTRLIVFAKAIFDLQRTRPRRSLITFYNLGSSFSQSFTFFA
jgi:hypothetical protein